MNRSSDDLTKCLTFIFSNIHLYLFWYKYREFRHCHHERAVTMQWLFIDLEKYISKCLSIRNHFRLTATKTLLCAQYLLLSMACLRVLKPSKYTVPLGVLDSTYIYLYSRYLFINSFEFCLTKLGLHWNTSFFFYFP